MFNTEHLQEKWQPVLQHPDLPEIKDPFKRAVTTVILENQERSMQEDSQFLAEAAPTNNTAGVNNWDPILISLIRRAMPNLIAYDVCGVQPMSGPTGLIFAMKSRYTNQSGTEAFMTQADTDFSAEDAAGDLQGVDHTGDDVLNDMSAVVTATGMTTAQAEALGDAAGNAFAEMAFSIDKVTVTAVSRALKAEYTMNLLRILKPFMV